MIVAVAMVKPSAGEPSSTSIGVDVVESLPLVLKEKETEEKNLDDEMNGAAGKVSDDGAAQDDSMGVLWRGGGGGGGVSFASPREGNLYKKLFRDKKAPLDYDMVLVRSNNNPTATDILERLDRANGKTVRYAMGQMMYNNKKEGNIRYRVKDLVYDLETMQYLKDPRINKQAAAREVGAVTGSLAAADPEVDIEELEGPPRRPIFGFHNPTNYCHGIASLVAVLLPGPICGARATHAGELF